MRGAKFRAVAAGGALSVAVLAGVSLGARPAWAHASLRSTEPADGVALARTPPAVVLRFDQGVEATLGAIRVFDSEARRQDQGAVYHPGGESRALSVAVTSLREGAYVVTWRAVSADSHTLRGAFTFRVGTGGAVGSATADLARRLLASQGGSPLAGALAAALRLATFASLMVLVGGLALVVVAGADLAPARPGVARLVKTAWAVLAGSTLLAIGVQGVQAGGLGLGDAVRPSTFEAVAATRFGRLALARLVLLLPAAAVARAVLAGRGRVSRWVGGAGAAVAGGLLLTVALTGHAATGDNVVAALAADVIHLGAASVWLGGLTALWRASRRLAAGGEGADPAALRRAARRFSGVATWSVGALAATGLFASWRQVGSLPALTGTTFGRLLLVKLALFGAVVALGIRSRRWARDRWPPEPGARTGGTGLAPGAPARATAGQRTPLATELACGVAVLAAAALLVAAVPARTAYGRPFSAELTVGPLLVNLAVDPARSGPVDVHVYTLTQSGTITDVSEVSADLVLTDPDVGPLRVPLRRAGPGHFAAYGFTLPLPGNWQLSVTARLPSGDSASNTVTFTVRR